MFIQTYRFTFCFPYNSILMIVHYSITGQKLVYRVGYTTGFYDIDK